MHRIPTTKLNNRLQILVYHADPDSEEQMMAELDLPADIFNSRYFGREASPSLGADTEFHLFAQLPRELRLQIWTWHLRRRRFLRVLLEEAVSEPEPEVSYPESASVPGSGPYHSLGDDDEWAAIFAAGPGSSDTEVMRETAGSSETQTSPSAGPTTAPPLRVTFLGAPSPAMPALRLVCREARDAHNSVYRIRLPALARIHCEDGARWHTTTRIVAYLNPELDILSLQAPNPPEIAALNLLPFFLHHLLQHDFSPTPLRFGARHLCVDLRHLGSDHRDGLDEVSHEDPAPLAPDVLASVRLAVPNLRSLYLRLVTTSHLEPRVMSGPFANTRSLPWYNASVPVLPGASWGFSSAVEPVRGGGDPRLACPEGAADLRQVWIVNQLRPSLDVWAGLKRTWGAPAGGGAGTRVRALVGLDAEGWTDRADLVGGGSISLEAYLRSERAAWQSLMEPALDMGKLLRGCFQTAQQNLLPGSGSGGPPAMAPEEWISRRQPHTAVGFWLIDPDMLEAAETTGYVGKKIANLSERGPKDIELWVFGGHS